MDCQCLLRKLTLRVLMAGETWIGTASLTLLPLQILVLPSLFFDLLVPCVPTRAKTRARGDDVHL